MPFQPQEVIIDDAPMGDTTAIRSLTQHQLAADVLLVSGRVRFRATGSSMLPAVRPGDVLEVHRREIHEVKCGEVAFFSCYGGVAAHRVISKRGLLITQGDSVPCPDPPVTAENLLGAVVAIERDGKVFAPELRGGLVARCTAAVLRRSDLAMRVWLHVHSLFMQSNLKIASPSLTASS
jgi:hypothetical protein